MILVTALPDVCAYNAGPPSSKKLPPGVRLVSVKFEADNQVGGGDAADAEAATHAFLDRFPGEWSVRFFSIVEQSNYGVSVRRGSDRGTVVFSAIDVDVKGMRPAVRTAIRVALAMIEPGAGALVKGGGVHGESAGS